MFGELTRAADRPALRFGDVDLTYRQLAGAAGAVAAQIKGKERVAVWATPTVQTAVAVIGALVAGVPVVPINPKVGERELEHILSDSSPDVILREADIDVTASAPLPDVDIADTAPAFIVYTSGTTGPPKGVVLPRRAVMSNVDALATAWEWTSEDILVHGLPLFHVHGLIIGIVGPLRRGGSVRHLGKFSSEAAARELGGDATMMFGVPTMYHRLAADAEADPALAQAVGKARLLVSGSAALPASDHDRIFKATGQRIVERYGMSETLMNCSVRAGGERRPGTVGPPVDGVDLRIVDERGVRLPDGEIGEIEVRGPNLFLEYLNRPDATAEAFRDGWFRTGDVATVDPDGYVRIVGRRATDLIKSGGYKIGAGEIENVLLEHPQVAEVAVTGEPDDDLGERIVAWIVPAGDRPDEQDLIDHVARLLTPHKRPRVVRFLDALPRNDMGKVTKRALSQ
ncbi:acyl-CoA synthetase [Kibdelosporangium phytohabitans]|uniref:Acyl-CoA synthetase n=1 Tax=Kibdelosporangium phytohabitans TaxID=860235 RepID=A0A0N9I6P6_9PSEU|nr:acyl-CoA synthetase [Kibdelosporangium phytohabitans]ALG13827.1 acyl-CoA synthetase [Kibdelosporangium phytohabitans]MBE1467245.1 acyl-CoA synthetase (AMP-forming)/AMP-acid ligase II [Kibdelosporangium phytohabitans]